MWEQLLSGIATGGLLGFILVGVAVIIALLIDIGRMVINRSS